jgi:hypothetical protein
MRTRRVQIIMWVGGGFLCLGLIFFLLAYKEKPERINYGISFNTSYALELGLEPIHVLNALVAELGVKDFRLSAHWTLIEPQKDRFDFALMDAEVERIEEAQGTIIMGVGRRLPRWPECHVPGWAKALSWSEQKAEIREYIEAVVTRYKDSPAITYWQVENEPFLEVFAYEHCGELDEAFLKEEIELVRSLDSSRPILVTDSGNLGTWGNAYSLGDAFGTSVYVYFWNPELGKFKTVLPPWFYRVKERFVQLIHGEKETMLIELSLEPWLLEPVTDVPLDIQYSRMNAETFDEIIEYARKTRFERQYLWGGEWWYWLKEKGNSEMWERGKEVFRNAE